MLTVRTNVCQPEGAHVKGITVVVNCPHGQVTQEYAISHEHEVSADGDGCAAEALRLTVANTARTHAREIRCRCALGALAATYPPVVFDIERLGRN